jgi:hypothetical protein
VDPGLSGDASTSLFASFMLAAERLEQADRAGFRCSPCLRRSNR